MPHPDHEKNRRSWNAATPAHRSHLPDQAAWFAQGGCQLYPEERSLLGDLAGRDVLHAQCNDGRDTLSLVNLWPGTRATGLDISDVAVELASQLSAASGVGASFVRADLLDWLHDSPADAWDVVFQSYGALTWLGDLRRWATGLRRVLKPGGRLVLVEFHPVGMALDDQGALRFDAMGGRRVEWAEGVPDYVGTRTHEVPPHWPRGISGFRNPHPAVEHAWGVADIVEALLRAGLALRTLQEWPYANHLGWVDGMVPEGVTLHGRGAGPSWPGVRYRLPPGMPQLPLMLGLVARRP